MGGAVTVDEDVSVSVTPRASAQQIADRSS
jgi:hypothetical protein